MPGMLLYLIASNRIQNNQVELGGVLPVQEYTIYCRDASVLMKMIRNQN